MSPPQTNSNIHTDTKNLMLKSIFVLTNVLLHFKQTGLHKKKNQKPFNINKVATCIYYHHPPPPHDVIRGCKYLNFLITVYVKNA